MRKLIAVCVVTGLMLSSVAPLVAQQHGTPKQDKKPAVVQAADSYVCPMHPDEKSTKPGTCSKCGMALEKKSGKPEDGKAMKHEGKGKGKCKCCSGEEGCGGK